MSHLQKTAFILFASWLVLGLAQAMHFHFYFSQPIYTSITWGLKNWCIWYVLILGGYFLYKKLFKTHDYGVQSALFLIVMSIVLGAVQIAIIIILDNIFFGYDKQFIDGFWSLYKKRWFQNILVFVILWPFICKVMNQLNVKPIEHSYEQSENSTDNSSEDRADVSQALDENRIKITDGSNHVWLEYNQIKYIEVTGNYLCFFTTDGQYVTRGTMKNITDRLASHGFLRISRFKLVNSEFISSYQTAKNNDGLAIKGQTETLSVSRRYKAEVKQNLSISHSSSDND